MHQVPGEFFEHPLVDVEIVEISQIVLQVLQSLDQQTHLIFRIQAAKELQQITQLLTLDPQAVERLGGSRSIDPISLL